MESLKQTEVPGNQQCDTWKTKPLTVTEFLSDAVNGIILFFLLLLSLLLFTGLIYLLL